MRPMKYRETLIAKVDIQTRETVEKIAYQRRASMAEITRELLYDGLRARGLLA